MLPGGKQEKDETPAQTAIRETLEETGIKAVNPKLKVIATHLHEYKSKIYLVFIFSSDQFSGDLIESEEGKPIWMPLTEALKDPKLYPDLKRHIGIVQSSSSDEVIFTYHKFDDKLNIVESI
ncbi:MAG: 7,8-dihydro-8-oxoguanine triphosphatase [Microgenomates group bacterium Gr01-1014_16]|nr:MAG: 7,8-dihydro-8-oxoguanine triphosphatase [Microgenomates group bacterium Gr01-1014_16]